MIGADANSLTFDLNRIMGKTKANAANVAKALALELEQRVVKMSPVDTGRLKGNWNVGINSPNLAEYPPDKTGAAPHARALGALSKLKVGDAIWITNNLPYTPMLEYGLYGDGLKTINGYSRQAPHGFIRVTYQTVMSAFENIARKVVK